MIDEAHAQLVSLLAADDRDREEDPADPVTVQAMQIALHIPKPERPARTPLLEAAARAVVAVCLDERAISDEAWQAGLRNWYSRRIRKVARRARNKGWLDAQALPGVTAGVDGAQARAFVPSAVAHVPHVIRKLQIKGTDLPVDKQASTPWDPCLPLLAINADLEMSIGKAAAQVGHASMLLAADRDVEWVRAWAETGFNLQVRELPAAQFTELSARPDAIVVCDAGYTEVAPNTLTVVALG